MMKVLNLPKSIAEGKAPPPKPLLASPSGLIMSPMTPPSASAQAPPPPIPMPPFFFLLLLDSFRFRVWMPSFFIVRGRFTCNNGNWPLLSLFKFLLLPIELGSFCRVGVILDLTLYKDDVRHNTNLGQTKPISTYDRLLALIKHDCLSTVTFQTRLPQS